VTCDSDVTWERLCALLGDPGLSAAWRIDQRKANAEAIEAAFTRWAASQTPIAAARRLQAAGIPGAPVSASHELWYDEHLLHVGFWTTLNRRYIGDHLSPNSPILFDEARLVIAHPAPTLGQHTTMALAAYI